MTTVRQYQEMDRVNARLAEVQRRHQFVQIGHAVAAVLTVVLGSLIVIGLAGFWPGQPPTELRWLLLAAALAVWAAGLVWFGVLPLRRRLNPWQTARLIEGGVGGLKNSLINALQLSADRMQPSPDLVASAIKETVRRTGKAPLGAAVSLRSLRRWCLAGCIALLLLGGFALLAGSRLSRGLSAVFSPTGYVREVGSVKLVSIEPGDTTLFAGETLTIVAKIDNPTRERHPARMVTRTLPSGQAGQTQPGEPTPVAVFGSQDRCTYSVPVGKVQQSFEYALWIGDSKFPVDKPAYRVTVLQRVKVEGLDLTYAYPAYTMLKAKSVVNASGPVEAPIGTRVAVALRLSAPVPKVMLDLRSGRKAEMRPDGPEETATTFRGAVDVVGDDAYRILLTDQAGRRLQQLPDVGGEQLSPDAMDGFYRIRGRRDTPPKIHFLEPNRDTAVTPGGKLNTRLRAADDYGVATVKFYLGREGEPPRLVKDFDSARGLLSVDLAHAIEITGEHREGDVLVYYAAVADGRSLGKLGGPQTNESARFKIAVQDAAKVAAERAKRYDQLRQKLLAILAKQETQRVNTEIARIKAPDLVAVRALGKDLTAGQKEIKVDILDVVDNFPFETDMVTIQQALALLGNNQAALAVTQARAVAGLNDLAGRAEACKTLAGTQDEIIQSLQTLLAILPSLSNPEAAKKTARGEDIPNEAKEKLAALKAALQQFIDEQRKIIEASRRLTKRPVDDFTKEQEKLLKELELAQDKWEKFLNEKFTDFSKMAQQDFSNPAMLKELISVKTDVTMAKDALKKKAIEIATAIEDNGIENAKTLTANIEKWLPDEPDRIKWDMEDPDAQMNVEQPELPKELEDLVGDLLEEEEDLFEEMDDITGKYTMSGDKGIGWDAMDGPISNMNAQGVTGNQLPNTSEISGRSGEGRQGKAVGEFVEDKAVGKGGRRTPTRLTPEPFQQGQVNDTSKEPAGGATGGGKLGGAGSEGLEGPLPPALKKELDRLGGKQAQLRNRAERLQAGFKVTDYSNYQFLKAITLMNRVQGDLDHYRYANALRQRNVTLGALRRTQLLLSGKIDVTSDATANMPKHIHDDITDAMKAKLPPAYREALQKYFTRIAESGEE